MSSVRHVQAGDGARLAYRVVGAADAAPLVLLHATLSTSGQLAGLVRELAAERRVLAIDRRGSGGSRLGVPRPVDMPEHVADLVALLDAEGIAAADIVGHSFGGVAALEFAARHPDRVRGVVAFEPPYVVVAPAEVRLGMRVVADAVDAAWAAAGPAGAAQAFIDGVSGPGTWDSMPERTRAFLASEGGGAYADIGLRGLDPEGLARIAAPVTLLGGSRSEPFYRPTLEALTALIPTARLRVLEGLRHTSPITEPGVVAIAILAALDAGRIPAPPAAETPQPEVPPR